MAIRNSAKAIIINEGKILLNKNQRTFDDELGSRPNDSLFYGLPGGGQNQYETLEEAVVRECLEETGYTVAVKRLAAIYEEVVMNAAFRVKHADYAHKVYFIFVCRLTDAPVREPSEIDYGMLGSEWVGLEKIDDIQMYPAVVRANLRALLVADSVLHLGADRIGAPA